MKIATIKFSLPIRIDKRQFTFLRSDVDKVDIELKGHTVRMQHKDEVVYTTLFNVPYWTAKEGAASEKTDVKTRSPKAVGASTKEKKG
jgi:hypothetical protein